MALFTTAKILSLLLNIGKVCRYVLEKISIFKRDRKIKKEYKKVQKDVKEGNIDELNDIFRR